MAQVASKVCDICLSGHGEYYCQQCDQLFCGNCKLSHLRAKISKNHILLKGPDIKLNEKIFCKEHDNENFILYCHDCDIQVCIQCSVKQHSRHYMTDLKETSEKIKAELLGNLEYKVSTANLNISKMEKKTEVYRDEIKAVIKTITEEGNYLKELIDKKVEALIKSVQDGEQKEIQNLSAYTESYREVLDKCITWQKEIGEVETKAYSLLLQKLKKIKTDVDLIELKQVLDKPSMSYSKKELCGTDIDTLFGKLSLRYV